MRYKRCIRKGENIQTKNDEIKLRGCNFDAILNAHIIMWFLALFVLSIPITIGVGAMLSSLNIEIYLFCISYYIDWEWIYETERETYRKLHKIKSVSIYGQFSLYLVLVIEDPGKQTQNKFILILSMHSFSWSLRSSFVASWYSQVCYLWLFTRQ